MFLIIQPTGDNDHCDVLTHRIERFILYIILYIIGKYIYKCKYTNVLDLNSSLYLAKFFIPPPLSQKVSPCHPLKRQRQVLLLELHLHSLNRCLMMNYHNVLQYVTATECDSDTPLLSKDNNGNFDLKVSV